MVYAFCGRTTSTIGVCRCQQDNNSTQIREEQTAASVGAQPHLQSGLQHEGR